MVRGLSVAGVALCLSVLSIGAQAVTRPNPPKQVCIGNNCVSTGSAKIKWNPGHYGASGGLLLPGDALSKFQPEMDDMMKDDWIVGYRIATTWGALDGGPVSFTGSVGGATSGTLTGAVANGSYWVSFSDGEYRQLTIANGTQASWSGALASGSVTGAHLYTTAVLDQMLDRMKSHYNKPKHLVVTVAVMSFYGGTRSASDYSRIPRYITTDKANGPSPDGRTYGWWGPPPGSTDGAYSAATYRPAVAARYADLGKALGARYDSDPNFEAIMDQETSAVVGPAVHFPPTDGTYSDAAYVAQMKMYLSQWLDAFPHTNIINQNTWLATSTPTQQFEVWMMQNRIAPGTADVSGQSFYSAGNLPSWGLATVMGVTVSYSTVAGPDMRSTVRPMVDIEQPDIGNNSGGKIGNKPLDIVTALNKTLMASHAFWCHNSSGPNPPSWPSITAVLQANPLAATSYPGNYP